MDTSISYSDYETAYFSTDEKRWIKKMLALSKKYPDDVKIKFMPEENQGVLIATIPPRMIEIKPKFTRMITAEESQRRHDRMIRLTDKQREEGKRKVKLD